MEDLEKTIKAISVLSTENWIAGVEWRKANKFWIRKSSDIALQILDALDELVGISPGWPKKWASARSR